MMNSFNRFLNSGQSQWFQNRRNWVPEVTTINQSLQNRRTHSWSVSGIGMLAILKKINSSPGFVGR